MNYLDELRNIKLYGKPPKEKKIYRIPKKSEKKIAEDAAAKDEDGYIAMKEKWFIDRRKEMTGTCQCGCNNPSQKNSEVYFRHSACHIFPKKKFSSVRFHPLNFVERAFWGGCHTNMDEKSINLWTTFADWNDIREKFLQLAPLLTAKEKATKFYRNLEAIVFKPPDKPSDGGVSKNKS